MKRRFKFVLCCVLSALIVAACLCGCEQQPSPTAKQQQALKQAYLELYDKSGKYTVDDVVIECFHGQYGDALVALMNGLVGHTQALWGENVGGFVFSYHEGNRIVVLRDGEFVSLQQAYEEGVLSQQDLRDICEIHKNRFGFLYEN